MYTTCLFCNRPLGANQTLEELPIGRCVAFDPAKGRVWVVCARCKRWNLTPIEERWEVTDACERLFRDTRRRFSTDNVGLAKLPSGLELIRIGEPQRPEFAAWRYGRRFELRRRNTIIMQTAAGAAAIGGAVLTGGILAAGYVDMALWIHLHDSARVVASLTTEDGEKLVVKKKHLKRARLSPVDGDPGWGLEVAHSSGSTLLTGPDAMNALWHLMSRVNPAGGARRTVESAVQHIEACGNPSDYLRVASRGDLGSRRAITVGAPSGAVALPSLPRATRLAVEMAVNEETERRVIEGELKAIEAAWRAAEQIAEIADDLLVPDNVRTALRDHRAR